MPVLLRCLARSFFLLLGRETEIRSALTGLLPNLKGLDRHLLLRLSCLLRGLECRLAKTLGFLPGLILSLTCSEAELRLLKPGSTICLKGLQRLLVGSLTAASLNVLKLLPQVALTLRLHDRFPVAA